MYTYVYTCMYVHIYTYMSVTLSFTTVALCARERWFPAHHWETAIGKPHTKTHVLVTTHIRIPTSIFLSRFCFYTHMHLDWSNPLQMFSFSLSLIHTHKNTYLD